MLSLLRSSMNRRWNSSNKYKSEPSAAGPALLRLALLVPALFGTGAQAGQNDALHPFFSLAYTHDDNLLRVPEGQPAFDNTLGDSTRSSIGGLVFDKGYGRQRLHAEGKLTKVKFGHFSQLDYDGKDLLARWNWQFGNDMYGTLSSAYNQVLAPYTDFHSSERNLRVQRTGVADGYWRFLPSWRAHVEASNTEYSYDLLSQRYNNRTEELRAIGFDYIASTRSTIGLVVRKIKGKYPNKRVIGPIVIDDSFEQEEAKAHINWLATDATTVNFLGGWARRTHVFFGDRDSKGANGRLTVTSIVTGSTQLNAALWREFSALESSFVSYSLNKGASIGASWVATSKIQVDASLSNERRSYVPNVAIAATDFSDTLKSASLGLNYSAATYLQLGASVYHQARTGIAAVGTTGFKANGMTVTATAQF